MTLKCNLMYILLYSILKYELHVFRLALYKIFYSGP